MRSEGIFTQRCQGAETNEFTHLFSLRLSGSAGDFQSLEPLAALGDLGQLATADGPFTIFRIRTLDTRFDQRPMTRHPRVICFDLGNVLVHFDHGIGCKEIARLTGIDPDRVHQILFDTSLQVDYETGRLSCEEVATRFNAAAGTRLEPERFVAAISDIFWLNPQIVPMVVQLRLAGYPLGILSNTCAGHWEHIRRKFPLVDRHFAFHVLSFEEGVMKPDPQSYRRMIERAGCPAEQILFLDDRVENVMAAQACGIEAAPFHNVCELTRWLDQKGIRVNE